MSQRLQKQVGVHFYPQHTFKTISAPERHCEPDSPVALYIHIPFCEARCYFCTFSIVAGSKVNNTLIDDYMTALKAEIVHFGRRLADQNVRIEMIQVGGGTPTALEADQIKDLFDTVFENFDCSALREIIFEGFPSSVTAEKVRVLRQLNQLKLNIGIQTFDQRLLDDAGRRHETNSAMETLRMCKGEGISSLGIDIIFGLPGSSVNNVETDIDTLLHLPVDHLAFYPLWIYEQTTFDKQLRHGKFEVSQKALQEQLAVGHPLLEAGGFERYTAFHFARDPSHHHGYGLWQMEARDWLGLGMSSMSSLQGSVFFNEKTIEKYIDKINAGQFETGTGRAMTVDQQMRFALLYGFRERRFRTAEFERRFGLSPQIYFADLLERLRAQGLVEFDSQSIDLTADGIISLGLLEHVINEGGVEAAAE